MLFESERLTLSASHSSTKRGSGDHHSGGWPLEYQGKMPRRYASSRRSSERSAPAASRPFGFFSARSTLGKGSPRSSQASTSPVVDNSSRARAPRRSLQSHFWGWDTRARA